LSALAPAERRRLVGALALLGSPVPGERDAAALAAHRIVTDRGLRWDDMLADPASTPRLDAASATTWRWDVALCARHPGDLRPWEHDFIANLQTRRTISLKQRTALTKIAARLRTRGRT